MQKAEVAAKEKNRASTVALNAEIRRTKARLLEEVPKLQRLALKKVNRPFFNFDSYKILFNFSSCSAVVVKMCATFRLS